MREEELRLLRPSRRFKAAFVELMDDFTSAGDLRYEMLRPRVETDFGAVVREWTRCEKARNIQPGMAPYRTYWLVRDERDILGTIRLRLRLTDSLRTEGGHIGYNIRPSERSKGYATRMLGMGLDKFREMGGYDRVLVTCDDDNAASARVIEKNGGARDADSVSPYSGKRVRRYWIVLGSPSRRCPA